MHLLKTEDWRLKTEGGFSLVELLIIITITAILFTSTLIAIRPTEIKARSRDAKRISDLGMLSQAIEQYIADNNQPPGTNMTVYTSTQSASPASARGTGWIPVNLTKYIDALPMDPSNTGKYTYRYYRTGNLYQLDAVLENYTDRMANTKDGGNDACHYETGNSQNTITLPGGC